MSGASEPGASRADLERAVSGLVDYWRTLPESQEELPDAAESDRRFQFILDQMRAFMLEQDESGTVTYVSDTVKDLLGFSPDELVGGRPVMLHDEDLPIAIEFLHAIRRGENRAAVFRLKRKDGEWSWFESGAARAFRMPDGSLRTFTFSRDVNQLKESLDALRESEERYRVVAEASRDLIVELDEDGVMTYVSPNAGEILGYAPESMVGRSAMFPVVPDDRERLEAVLASGMDDGDPKPTGAYRALHRDGSLRWLESRGVALQRANGEPGYLSVTRDITDQIHAERQRAELTERMQQSQKLESLGVMAGGIAHDFNNLLTPILGEASLALLDLPQDSPLRERLVKVQRAAHRASELTNQMLAYAGEGTLVTEPIDLSELAGEMARLLESAVSGKARLDYELASGLPPVEADVAQLSQVVMNLITNAAEAVGGDEGVVAVATGIVSAGRAELDRSYLGESLAPGEYVYLEVSDTGCGMDVETRSRIFDPFFTTKRNGRGLGLAAVMGIVRSHRGAIEIDSAPGQGTRARVLFPASIGRRPRAPEPVAGSGIRDWRGEGVALVVDDEPGVRDLARETLTRAGFDVLTAEDGAAGIELFRRHADEVRVVLLDRTMPITSGEEAFEELRRIRSDAKIVMVSGYTEEAAAARLAGLAGFLKKPFRPEALLESVRRVLEGEGDSEE